MFIVDLPYSKKTFSIKVLVFEHVLAIARLLYDKNSIGAVNFLIETLEIQELNILDKFFVLLKARELFINEHLSLSSQKGNVNVGIQSILNTLFDLPNFNRVIKSGNIIVELDLPKNFVTSPSDLFVSSIQTLTIDDVKLDFKSLSKSEQDIVLKELPSSLFNAIKTYTYNTNAIIAIFKGKESLGLSDISLNFFTQDPFIFVKSIYEEYTLHACREILFYLGKRLSTEFLLKCTPADIQFYMSEYTSEIKNNKSSGNLNQII